MKSYTLPTIEIKFNKIFLLADTHFGVRANSLEWLQNQLNFFDEFYFPLLKEKIKEGDIFFFFRGFFR